MNKISVIKSWKFGWGVFKKNWMVLIYTIAVTSLVGVVIDKAFKADELKNGGIRALQLMLPLIGYYILKYLLDVLFKAGQTKINLDAADGKETKYSDLFNSQGVYLKLLGVSILYALAVLGGFIILVVPGIYIAIRYCFAPILVVDKKMRVTEAFVKSREMTKDIKWQLLGFFALSVVFILLGLIALGVGIIVTFVVYRLAFVHLYRQILNENEEEENGGQMDFQDIPSNEVEVSDK